jgi:predicted DNA-binding transcriptional regulator YafY
MPRTRIIGAEAERDAVHHPFARERFADVWNRPGNPRLTPAVIGIDECLPGYRLNRKLKSSDEDAPHLEQTDVMQYLSPRHTEELLELAIRYRHPVVIDYYIGNRNNSHMQRVRPLRIDRTRGSPYLEAFRLLEEDNRVFKIAQIKAIRVIYNEKE